MFGVQRFVLSEHFLRCLTKENAVARLWKALGVPSISLSF